MTDKYDVPYKLSFTYTKPYTPIIDFLKIPEGYQPQKFHQFDDKGNRKQHIAHFVETCCNARQYGDYLVKKFVCSLQGNAFDWYMDLEVGSIDDWEQLEHKFLNLFYSTRRSVSIIELKNTRQLKDEHVIEFMNQWRNASLNCKAILSETSGLEMCIEGTDWGFR